MTTETELRHLLEMAARALRYAFIKPADGYDGRLGLEIGDNPMRTQSWNPYADDGDSARMRSALGIGVDWRYGFDGTRVTISAVICIARLHRLTLNCFPTTTETATPPYACAR